MIDPLDLDPRTEAEARAALAVLEAERERLGRVIVRCRTPGMLRYLGGRCRLLDVAWDGIVGRFGFEVSRWA